MVQTQAGKFSLQVFYQKSLAFSKIAAIVITMKNRMTLKQAGYRYFCFNRIRHLHILRDIETGKLEAWAANRNHASFGLVYKNTHLEFVSSYSF